MDLVKINKADLHCHLVGAITPNELSLLAKNIDLDTAHLEPLETHFNFSDTEIWTLARKAISTPENLGLAMELFLGRQSKLGITYCEPIINFHKILKAGVDTDQVTSTLENVFKAAHEKYGITSKVRIGLNRADGPEGVKSIKDFYYRYSQSCYVGIDLNGDERKFPITLFQGFFQKLKQDGVNYTIHAGEGKDLSSSLEQTIDLLPKRIGHGLALTSDQKLIAQIIEKNIVIEVCLTSNLLTGEIDSMSTHPIHLLEAHKVPYVICTDDPSIFKTNINDELKILLDLGFTEERVTEIARYSLQVAAG